MTLTAALRPVNLGDIPAFHAVMMAAGMDPRSSWSRTTPLDLERSLFSPGAGGFLAVGGGEEAFGCVGYRPDSQDTLTLNKLATRPEARGTGLGRALVRQVEHVARAGGYGRVLLAVSLFNLDVLPFYEKLGYVVTDDTYAHANPSSPPPVVLVKPISGAPVRAEGSSPRSEDATQ
ncbi:GNAT family N-acetyltransferase [Deinococcus sp. KSM4-11]|uniref:GNAT family N-acetyltransferase n=1 Tax=Deinococcus sp. KSM4-11 TaxID=2568654 RepID=UPI0010A4748A|nr:GNAT family N-acetyltransferase [Deinococcus sp. KSM4-11]THF85266.1 GNAT family N-acetyltransferase [Deinococcus sp. KSM4-11]